MSTADPATPVPELQSAQQAYEQGRYDEALRTARALDAASETFDSAAMRLRCLAAWRAGEIDEAARTAERMIAAVGSDPGAAAARFDVLAVSVVAAGELARFDQSIAHLKLLLPMAARADSLTEFVRARGTAATCFTLIGDPWAGLRLLSELVGLFQGGTPERRLEATVRTNHAAVCLQIARLARQGGDAADCDEALEFAAASLERAREIARQIADARTAAFADVHAAELALLHGDADAALAMLAGTVDHADAAGLAAHARQLRLLEAEARQSRGDTAGAQAMLEAVRSRLNEGHEIGSRIRYHSQQQRVCSALGDAAAALAHLEQARALAQYRQYRQSRAQSQHLRTRLELEHMYRYRTGTTQGRASRPGSLRTR